MVRHYLYHWCTVPVVCLGSQILDSVEHPDVGTFLQVGVPLQHQNGYILNMTELSCYYTRDTYMMYTTKGTLY